MGLTPDSQRDVDGSVRPRDHRRHMVFGGSTTVALKAGSAFLPRWDRGDWASKGHTVDPEDSKARQKVDVIAAFLAALGPRPDQ